MASSPLSDAIESETRELYKDCDIEFLQSAMNHLRDQSKTYLVSIGMYSKAITIKKMISELQDNGGA